MSEPRGLYESRRDERSRSLAFWQQRDQRLGHARLFVFGVGLALAFAAFGFQKANPVWLVGPAGVFGGLLLIHDRVVRKRDQAERAVAFYESGLARIEHRFAGTGNPGDAFRDTEHAYADDLDVFGRGSLFELLCGTRTLAGEETLARWLLQPADPPMVRARQDAVDELRDNVRLREDLALLGDDVRSGLHPDALRDWGEAPPVGLGWGHAAGAAVVSAFSVAGLVLWTTTPAGPIPLLAALAVQGALGLRLRRRVLAVVQSVETPSRELALFAAILARLEAEPVACQLLAELRAELDSAGFPPSRRLSQLRRRVELLDARRNQLFAPLAALLCWSTQLAVAIEHWRSLTGPHLARWMQVLGELESLASLAGYAFEHPSHVFPEFSEDGPLFDATGLGHPLLPAERCVPNDLRLDADRQLLLVSGSNMSGKSTLLRAVGVAALLAQAGGVVNAVRLRLSPLSIGAAIRVSDSLQEGTSHFMAELQHVRRVLDLTDGERPTLFLLDEIFHGTNSHDRTIGADAVLTTLVARRAIGLVTTHDLALAEVAERLAPRAMNVHFEDQLEQDRIVFDYRMRPGVVTRSNALALMRAVGLPVDTVEPD